MPEQSELVITGYIVLDAVSAKHLSRVYTSRSAAEDFLALAIKNGHQHAMLQAVYNYEHGTRRKHVGHPG